MSVLYKHYARYQKLIHGEDDPQKSKGKKRKKFARRHLLLQVFYYEQLTRRRSIGGKLGLNRFLDGGGRLLHRQAPFAICLDLARLIQRDPKKKGDLQSFLQEAYHNMYAEGPGCFSWDDEKKINIKYVPCFHPCPCGSEAMKPPFKPYREMCEKNSHEYEPCTARRDTRTLVRRHDDKVKPLPEAEVGGVYIPLMMTMVAGVACLCISFLDQILGMLGIFSRS
ncbi:hypothetical protein ANCCAN_16929 [Ancylostoma caninum]|uniref:Uncharacterized protein n=1 Tax=Ancylostoma caninum TaxID=29170 RepID=A0A368FYB2_ANCCA|nr:hypothetical protein ANCCAN_16929 [Ancylostoma caninum]